MSTEVVRTPEGFKSNTTPSGTDNPTFDAGEVNVTGTPLIVIYDNATNGAANLTLPSAQSQAYTGKRLILDVSGSLGNEITLVDPDGTPISNDPSPITSSENIELISDGSAWTAYSLTPA